MRRTLGAMVVGLALALSGSLAAKESLGVFSHWAAFRDAQVPRCYAIAEAETSELQRDFEPYATVGFWPARRISGQIHFRLSRKLRTDSSVTLRIGRQTFRMVSGLADAWGANSDMDFAIRSAMRKTDRMTVYGVDARGRRFSNTYLLAGAATAIDSATLACKRG